MLRLRIAVTSLSIFAASALAQPEATPILPPELPWSGRSLELALAHDDPWATPFEAAGMERTPRYAETVAWLERVTGLLPELTMTSIGRSAEGREIWMVVASKDGSTPEALAAGGRPTLLAHAGIHSGEIDGKDAGMMLLRDMRFLGRQQKLLD